MYAITGITGNVGGSVAHHLLSAGQSVDTLTGRSSTRSLAFTTARMISGASARIIIGRTLNPIDNL